MRYNGTIKGMFIERPNRFTGIVDINGRTETCHINNTGRCEELFIEGTEVILNKAAGAKRRTEYDIIAVRKGNMLINIDSQAPNKVFAEFVNGSGFIEDVIRIKPEYGYKDSRFDFLIETKESNIIAEVKGVTLEDNGIAKFPDAPTERGLKHVRELTECISEGYGAYLVFVIQMDGIKRFTPNAVMQKEFADAVAEASEKGVNVVAFNCHVDEDNISIKDQAEVICR